MARNPINGMEDDELVERNKYLLKVSLPGQEEVSLQTPFPWIGTEWELEEEDDEW